MKILLKHGHLVLDGNREYLDGAVRIEDGRIVEVFPQTDRIREENPEPSIESVPATARSCRAPNRIKAIPIR